MIAYKAYDRTRAVSYARRYAFSRNPLFYNFTGVGGDCTNFVSQALLAGSCVMNGTPDFGWYYRSAEDRAPAWTSVEFFWEYMTEAPRFVTAGGNTGPFGRAVSQGELLLGDVIQLANAEGDYYHTLLVTGFEGGEPLVAAHSIDTLDRPLGEYNYATARFLHIVGVRVPVSVPDCFADLLAGRALPSPLS
ncbi:MAG: amidase [Ruminococcaceae bacterium]|nr:amidase [Oscillospiraceae bacterium]